MCRLRYILLVLSAVSVALGADKFVASEVCSNLTSIINVIKQFTNLSIDIDFNSANRILHGPATIKLTDEIVARCKALEMDDNTILFIANLKDNITITFQERAEIVEIEDCSIVVHITVTRDKPDGHTITVRPHLIEVTDFSETRVNGTAMNKSIALELLKPDLTNALTASELSRPRQISHSVSHVNPFLLKQILDQIYQFFLYRLSVKQTDQSS